MSRHIGKICQQNIQFQADLIPKPQGLVYVIRIYYSKHDEFEPPADSFKSSKNFRREYVYKR